MFHNIPQAILDRMHYLEELDALDRKDGTSRQQRLRQIQPETGRFLALLAASAPDGEIVEIGTSAGYSTLWLSLAARKTGRKIITYETDEFKVKLARETFEKAEVGNEIELVFDDVRTHQNRHMAISFCFLDAEKEDYQDFYNVVVPSLTPGGILVADNVISHREALDTTVRFAQSDLRVDAIVVPIGKGELVCRKV